MVKVRKLRAEWDLKPLPIELKSPVFSHEQFNPCGVQGLNLSLNHFTTVVARIRAQLTYWEPLPEILAVFKFQ